MECYDSILTNRFLLHPKYIQKKKLDGKFQKIYFRCYGLGCWFFICTIDRFYSSLPQNYDNKTSLNLPSPAAYVEKAILSPKELVDISVNTMMTDPVLKNATWGFVVYDPKTKKIISSYNENTPLVPASTTKLLTTETAMSMLGENYQAG
ncbi:D-alanyl-D-alanine carboxypeptidase [Chryseobacterium indoltheticum]|uniref:D-alanyl-D-alanine carboxypeptidase n=1 Tax=Chryseobacterium indoltheticum TaxID=254 RepID=UPI003F490B31